MSQARITLRPPPNVEFVEGYPGIPAGHDRPHAEVRGTIELRLPAQGTKAKWVRVELKKVETLPGGGQSNTFFDFVGQSPVKVWEADGEWGLLQTSDFPFAIRIPESIPPSIALERGAGIKYELNATLCTKGKKGFFFKKKDATLSTSHPIIIDKHELHSTWPVYAQPETRHVMEEMLVLTVERTHTCYGPGDRIKVMATFKNDGIPAAALRAFEFQLKETIIFRAAPHVSGKKANPQIHVTPIGEQKVPVNMSVYQGQQHRAELGCFIPQTHTTTTVSAARHMDIAYSTVIKAVMGTGKPLLMELPVTVSNWPRNMSIEAVRRIGPAPNLSLVAPMNAAHQTVPNKISVPHSASQGQPTQQANFNTAPARSGLFPPQHHQISASQTMSQTSSAFGDPVTGPRSNFDEFGYSNSGPSNAAVPRGASPAIGLDYAGARRNPVNTNPSRRLTLANAETDAEADTPPNEPGSPKQNASSVEDRRPNGHGGSSTTANEQSPPRSTTGQRSTAWPTAEEEKQRLFNQARQQALRTQASMGNNLIAMPGPTTERPDSSHQGSPPAPSMPVPEPAPAPARRQISASSKNNTPWPTAEDEKLRLYTSAKDAVRRTQGQGLGEGAYAGGSAMNGGSPPANKSYFNDRPGSSHNSSSISHEAVVQPSRPVQPTETKSAGAQLYQHAMASINRNPSLQASVSQSASPPSSPPKPAYPGASQRSYPTAEEEKAALRYHEAKRAVERHQQNDGSDGPIAYEDLYPSGPSSRQGGSSRAVNGYGHGPSGAINGDNDLPPPISTPPPGMQPSMIESAMSEKERLRRKYEAEDAAAAAGPPTPPARASGSRSSPPGYASPPPESRSQPLPPADYSGPRMLTAAEEKARLKAQLEAEDAAAAGASSGSAAGPSNPPPPSMAALSRATSLSYAPPEPVEEFNPPPPPPPLAPRPPAEYIQQTKEEDLRSQAEHTAMPASSTPLSDESRVDFGLSFRPFSPLDLGVNFESLNRRTGASSVPPPPPLPPKVPVTQ